MSFLSFFFIISFFSFCLSLFLLQFSTWTWLVCVVCLRVEMYLHRITKVFISHLIYNFYETSSLLLPTICHEKVFLLLSAEHFLHVKIDFSSTLKIANRFRESYQGLVGGMLWRKTLNKRKNRKVCIDFFVYILWFIWYWFWYKKTFLFFLLNLISPFFIFSSIFLSSCRITKHNNNFI